MPYFLFLGHKHLCFLCYFMLLSRGNFRPVMFKTPNQIVQESQSELDEYSKGSATSFQQIDHSKITKEHRKFPGHLFFLGVYTGVSPEDFHPPPKQNSELPQSRAVVVVCYPGDQDQLESLRLLDLGQETLGSK